MHAWPGLLITVSFLAIVFFTLFPFNFTVPHGMTLWEAAAPFDWRPYDPSDPIDTVLNVLLFSPFGFALASLAFHRTGRLRRGIAWAACASFTFACCIEFLQRWLPLRSSALADICSNTTGGIAGGIIFLLFGIPLLRGFTHLLTITLPRLSLIAIALIFLLLLACAVRGPLRLRHLHRDLAGWDTTYPMAVGNDPKGDRAWEGIVTRIDIAAAAISPSQIAQAYGADDLRTVLGDSVLAEYRIEPLHNTIDLTHQSPDLKWIGIDSSLPIDGVPNLSANFSIDHWLHSAGPMSRVCETIRDTSQFTIRCKFHSAHPSQAPEMGRILTIAFNSLHCNFTLGQRLTDLVIRLRTPLTGDNGTNPACKIPDFFLEPAPHDLILTYDDPVLRVYVDGAKNSHATEVPTDFGGVSRFLARSMTLPFGGILPEMYRFVFYLFTFAPLALVIPIIAIHRGISARGRRLAMAAAFFAPTLAMQCVLIWICHRSFRTDNLIYGLTATAIVAFPMIKWLHRLDRAQLDC